MKIDGETLKLKLPTRVSDVVKDYPGHVLLDYEAVKHFGIRAKPLGLYQELKPKKIYFLVEMPKIPAEKAPRRVQSGIQMSAKDRLECLMLSRRAVSDLSAVKFGPGRVENGNEPVKVKLRLPRAQVAKLVEESKDGAEVAEKIVNLYMDNNNSGEFGSSSRWQAAANGGGLNTLSFRESLRAPKKRVNFTPPEDGEIQLASQ